MALLVAAAMGQAATSGTVRFVGGVDSSGPVELWARDGLFVAPEGTADQTVDLQGGYVVRGLADAHGHVAGLGRALEIVDLVGATSWAECVARTAARRGTTPWILGRGWDQNDWPGMAFPDREALDAALPGVPVVLTRIDGHALIASTAALEAAGAHRDIQDPPGGRWLRRPDGALTGVAIDAAMPLVERAVPRPTAQDRERWLRAAFSALVAQGLTAVHEMGLDRDTLDVLVALDRAGALPLRVYAYTDGLIDGVAPLRGDRLAVVGVKLFADGALGSRGAALLAPYSDDPHQSGLMQYSPEALAERVASARARGFQLAVHAIGDQAVRAALDVLQRGDRVEHAQVVAPQDLGRFAAQGVWASMQPVHQTSDMAWAEARLGPERIHGAYAWRALADAGAPLAFGTDFPIERPDPRATLWAAASRQPPGGGPSWYPQQRLDRAVALAAMTRGAAQAVGETRAVADFTVFDRDLLAVPIDQLLEARVVRVVVGGRTVSPEPSP